MTRRKKIIILSVVAISIAFLAAAIYLVSKYLSSANTNQTAGSPPYGDIPAVGTLDRGTFTISKSGTVYTFSFKGDENITYLIDTQDPNIKKGLLKIKAKVGNDEFYPITSAAPVGATSSTPAAQFTEGSTDQVLVLNYTDQFSESVTRARTVKIEPKGKSLAITFNSQGGSGVETTLVEGSNNYTGLALGSPAGTSGLKKITIPYMPDVPIAQVGSIFFSAYLDKTQSHATLIPPPDKNNNSYVPLSVKYESDHDQKVSNLNEVAYLTVSSKIEDTFPYPNNPTVSKPKRQGSILGSFFVDYNLPSKVGPLKSNLEANETSCQTQLTPPSADNPAAELPIAVAGESFNQYYFHNAKVFLEMADKLGLNDLIYGGYTNWGQMPGNEYTPKRLPICDRSGGESQYQDLISAAKRMNQTFIDHENWFAVAEKYLLSGSSSYDQELAFYTSKKSDDSYRQHTDQKIFSVSPDGLLAIAQTTINKLTGSLSLKGTFLDTLTSFYPARIGSINLGSANKNSRNLSEAIANLKKFFVYLNQNFAGPIVGEGGKGWDRFDSYYAGYIDGVEREHDSHKNAAIIPDFELKMVAPKSSLNFGMGWHERWECQKDTLSTEGDAAESSCTAKFGSFDFDRYRAQTISFGHAGFLPESLDLDLRDPNSFHKFLRQVVSEYYLVQQLQSQYVGVKISSIDYFDTAKEIGDLATVYKTKPNYDFKNDRIKLVYANGLTIFINNDQSQNWAVSTEVGNYDLPPNGFIAYNKNQKGWQGNGNFLVYSANVNQARTDFVSSEDYLFTSGRSVASGLSVEKSNGLKVNCNFDPMTPRCQVSSPSVPPPPPVTPTPSTSPTPTPSQTITPTPKPSSSPGKSPSSTVKPALPIINPDQAQTPTPSYSYSATVTPEESSYYESNATYNYDNYQPENSPSASPSPSPTAQPQTSVLGSTSVRIIIFVVLIVVFVLVYLFYRYHKKQRF